MTLYTLLGKVEDDSDKELSWFLDFAEEYLDFTKFGEAVSPNIQADIVSQNESNYHFIQYKDDGKHFAFSVICFIILHRSGSAGHFRQCGSADQNWQ